MTRTGFSCVNPLATASKCIASSHLPSLVLASKYLHAAISPLPAPSVFGGGGGGGRSDKGRFFIPSPLGRGQVQGWRAAYRRTPYSSPLPVGAGEQQRGQHRGG